tara:strand:- start:60 stop:401 length:342 start_codon:yes stop_codon:yes gene_type:complete
MVQYLLSGGVFMIPIYLSLIILIYILSKNFKSSYHIDKIMLIGSFTAIFGIIATAVGISNAMIPVPNISMIAPHILLDGLKTSLVTTFAGGFILFFSTVLWYFLSKKYKSKTF